MVTPLDAQAQGLIANDQNSTHAKVMATQEGPNCGETEVGQRYQEESGVDRKVEGSNPTAG